MVGVLEEFAGVRVPEFNQAVVATSHDAGGARYVGEGKRIRVFGQLHDSLQLLHAAFAVTVAAAAVVAVVGRVTVGDGKVGDFTGRNVVRAHFVRLLLLPFPRYFRLKGLGKSVSVDLPQEGLAEQLKELRRAERVQ